MGDDDVDIDQLKAMSDLDLHKYIGAVRVAATLVKRNHSTQSPQYKQAQADLVMLDRQIDALVDLKLSTINKRIRDAGYMSKFGQVVTDVNAIVDALDKGGQVLNQISDAVAQMTEIITAIGGVIS